jgi:hypothetical protein
MQSALPTNDRGEIAPIILRVKNLSVFEEKKKHVKFTQEDKPMNARSIPAHFDGEHILLDETIELEPNTMLIVTVLPKHDSEREEWLYLSGKRLENAYEPDEEDYSLDLIKEVNPLYEGR